MKAVILAALLASAPLAQDRVIVRPDSVDTGCTGFTLFEENATIASVRWTDDDRWVCDEPVVTGGELRFRGFRAPGTPSLTLAPSTEVVVALDRGRAPEVRFRFEVSAFDAKGWEADWSGPRPLTFLRCQLPDSADPGQLMYQGGELYPGPEVDPFPITQTHMKGSWAPGWSYLPAMGALPIPAVGLWSPASSLFVGYDFQAARSGDRSDYLIASAYHRDEAGQSITLGYPHAVRWLDLRLPEGPFTVESRFRLVWSREIASDSDPNRWLIRELLTTHGDSLPPAPRMNDMSWLRQGHEASQLLFRQDLGEDVQAPRTNVAPPLYREWEQCEKVFFAPGAVQLCAHQTGKASSYAWLVKDTDGLLEQKRQLDELVKHVRWEQLGDDLCPVWDHPLEGSFNDSFGGPPATGTRHMFSWGIASAMLQFTKHTGLSAYLPYLDGMVKWTRHYLYDRAGMADLPWAVFSMGAANGGEFLLDYAYQFRDDPARKGLAEEAWRLADVVVYRNLYAYTCDPNWEDSIDPTFLLQAVNAFPWIGMVTWGEMGRIPEMAIQMYLETGDPFYAYLVRGCLERFYVGTIGYGGNYTENLQVFGETGPKGSMSGGWGGNNFRWLAEPLGGALAQIDVGRRAAMAFCRGTRAIDIADYAFRPESGFGFTLTVDPRALHAPSGAFDIQVTAPRRDLHGQQIRVNGEPVPAGRLTVGTAGTDLLLRGVKAGDRVTVGEVGPEDAVDLPALRQREPFSPPATADFECLDLRTLASATVDNTWQGEWGGLWSGPGAANGVPWTILDPDPLSGRAAISLEDGAEVRVDRGGPAVLLWGLAHKPERRFGPTALGEVTIRYADGSEERREVTFEGASEAARGMVWYDRDWLLLQIPVGSPGRAIASVAPRGQGALFAVTLPREGSEVGIRAVEGVLRAQEERLRAISYREWATPLAASELGSEWRLPEMPYRFALSLDAGESTREDRIVRVREAFDALLAQVAADPTTLASPVVRVFTLNEEGQEGAEVEAQFDPFPGTPLRGELLLRTPDAWKGTRRFVAYLGDGPANPNAALRCEVTPERVSFDSGAARGVFTLRASGIGPRLTELAFAGGANLLAKSGWDEGFGHLCACQDGVTWYDFAALQRTDARAEVVSAGPLALTFRVTGLEIWGAGSEAAIPGVGSPGSASAARKGLAEWWFRLYAGSQCVDSWVHSSLSDPDTRWTRPIAVRLGTAGSAGARTLGQGGAQGTAAAEGGLALVALDDLSGAAPVQPAYTKEDGSVLQVSLEGSGELGACLSNRWRMMPDEGDPALAGQGRAVSVLQGALERWSAGSIERPAPAAVEVHEAPREDDWLSGFTPLQARVLTAGTPDVEQGLRSKDNADEGHSVRATVAGRAVLRPGSAPTGGAQHFLYFDVTDGTPDAAESARAYVVVDYWDQGFGTVELQYDSADQTVHVTPVAGVFKASPKKLPLGDTRQWRSFAFPLPDAHFRDRCNGADFRLDLGTGPILIRRIAVVFPGAR